jgi:hypothetical protein
VRPDLLDRSMSFSAVLIESASGFGHIIALHYHVFATGLRVLRDEAMTRAFPRSFPAFY